MKKLFITSFACLLTLTISNKLTAQESSITHRIIHVKFHPDQIKKAMSIARNYCKAYAAAGHTPTIFESDNVDRKWDAIFILPMTAGAPDAGEPHPKIIMKQLSKMLGEEVDLVKLHQDFTAMILEMSMEDVRQGKF